MSELDDAHHLRAKAENRVYELECELKELRDELSAMLDHSHIADSADEDKMPDDLMAESRARALIVAKGQ